MYEIPHLLNLTTAEKEIAKYMKVVILKGK